MCNLHDTGKMYDPVIGRFVLDNWDKVITVLQKDENSPEVLIQWHIRFRGSSHNCRCGKVPSGVRWQLSDVLLHRHREKASTVWSALRSRGSTDTDINRQGETCPSSFLCCQSKRKHFPCGSNRSLDLIFLNPACNSRRNRWYLI